MSMFGGGPMWGGAGGGGLGGGGGRAGAWGGAGNATQGGAPFAGIPPELADAVTKLVATEPDHGEPDAVFTQRVSDTRPLTLMRMIEDRWRVALSVGDLLERSRRSASRPAPTSPRSASTTASSGSTATWTSS